MHVVSMPGTLLSSSVNPHSCLLTGTQQFTWGVTGAPSPPAASPGRSAPWRFWPATPDGSCSFTQFPRHEVDKFAESGTLLL